MLINLEGPPLKALIYEMGGATDADQPRGTTPKIFLLFFLLFRIRYKEKQISLPGHPKINTLRKLSILSTSCP